MTWHVIHSHTQKLNNTVPDGLEHGGASVLVFPEAQLKTIKYGVLNFW